VLRLLHKNLCLKKGVEKIIS
jgi:hypothetical protein